MPFLEKLKSLRITFPVIEEATENFTTQIGYGGYGFVYRGELKLSGKSTIVAAKRNKEGSFQGLKEFLTEIQLLTRYKHPNLISLIGFCDEDDEKILIYEHAERGSLDKHLSTAEKKFKLTWKLRLNICVNAARGLNFLHNEVAPNERVIHRDIKSANILLDGNWKAMISDLGTSKLGRANEEDTFLITRVYGTHPYCDPLYSNSVILTKESDVYSFGVVLLEVLCGGLDHFRGGYINVNGEYRPLSSLAQSDYKIDEIVDPVLKNQIDSDSLDKFSKIAFQCLQENREKRPSMRTVLKKLEELEKAVEFQQGQDTDRLLYKTQAGMDGAVGPDQHKSEHVLKSEIAKFTDNGGLIDIEGVENIIRLMQLESHKENVDISCRVMLADVISVTDKFGCLYRFVQTRGLHVLDEWLQEVNKGKIGDGTSIEGSNNSIEDFLFALLRALDVLPVNLLALQTCNIGKSVNHLRNHKNSEIQKKSKTLIDKWMARVEAEANIVKTRLGTPRGGA